MTHIFEDGKKQLIIKKYNYDLYREAKNIPDSKFDMETGSWRFDKKYLNALIDELKKMNIFVTHNIKIADNQEKYVKKVESEQIKTVGVHIVKENNKSVVIKFDFDHGVLNTIKAIERTGRKFNGSSKTWTIRKEELEWLGAKLSELGYVDISDLNEYMPNSHSEIVASDFPYLIRKPFDFQLSAANDMLKYKAIINALEAGLGKTMTAIMVTEKVKAKTIIICPATVKENWKKEIHLVNHTADVVVLENKDEYRSADYVILNYDILKTFYNDLINDNYNAIIFDEAHSLRGVNGKGQPSSQRAKFGLSLASGMEYVFPLTATPFINKTKDIFNLLKVIRHPSSRNWFTFANTYCGAKKTGYGTSYEGSSNQEALFKRLYPTGIIRMRAEDHIDLPDLVRNFIPIKINLKKYEAKIQEYMNERKTYEDNGQHLVMLGAARRILAKEKVKHAVDLAKEFLEQGESVVILSNYTDVVESISKRFKNDSVVITGDVTSANRQKAVELFQSGEKKVLVGNADAAGQGITLTKSRRMIVVDMHWSPVFMAKQMEKRINRISQTGIANVYYLYAVGASVDEKMAKMAEEKMSSASLALDGQEETFIDELIESMI